MKLNQRAEFVSPTRSAEWYAPAIQTAGLSDMERRPSSGDRSRAVGESCGCVGEAEGPPTRSADSGLAL